MIYYIDAGKPTNGQRVFNPNHYQERSPETLTKTATSPAELVCMPCQLL